MAVTVEDVRVRVTVDGADGYDDLRDKQKDLEDQSKSTGGALDGLKAGLVNVAAAIQIAQAAVGALITWYGYVERRRYGDSKNFTTDFQSGNRSVPK